MEDFAVANDVLFWQYGKAALRQPSPGQAQRLVSGLPLYPRKAEGVYSPFTFSIPDFRAS